MIIPLLGFPNERVYGEGLYHCQFPDGRSAFVEDKSGGRFHVLIYTQPGARYGTHTGPLPCVSKLVGNLMQAVCLIEHYLGGNSEKT